MNNAMLKRASKKVVFITLSLFVLLMFGLTITLFAQAQIDKSVVPEYVAMGSSFAAGPGIGHSAKGPFLCARSRINYAHVLASLRGLSLLDVTCSGASTIHILSRRQWFQIPQLEAVDERTRLVTITIGGNDINYIGSILSCQVNPSWLTRMLNRCELTAESLQGINLDVLEDRLVDIATKIHEKAPKVKVVFVAYPAVLPDNGTCQRLGLSIEHSDQVRELASRLLSATRRASVRADSLFLDSHLLSKGHNVCSKEPWIFSSSERRLAAFHPNARAMRAIADQLQKLLAQN